MEEKILTAKCALAISNKALIKAKKTISEAITISKELDSLILVSWNSAEGSELDPAAYADVFAVMSRMSSKLIEILKAEISEAKDEN